MKSKLISIFCIISLILCALGCGASEESTTVTGIVVSVDGTVVSVRTMGSRGQNGENGQRGQRPTGEMPERPTGEMSERPDGEGFPGRPFDGEMSERPDGEGFPGRPSDGEMPDRPIGESPERPTGEEERNLPSFGGANTEAESYDLAAAHISVEIDEGKASGTMEDIKEGTIVTLTLNKKGQVTQVLVSSRTLFGFGNRGGENGQRPQRGENQGGDREDQAPTSEAQADA